MSTSHNPLSSAPEDPQKAHPGEYGSHSALLNTSSDTRYENAASMGEHEADLGELVHVDPSPLDEPTARSSIAHGELDPEDLKRLSLSSKKPERLSLQTQLDVPPTPPQKDGVYIDPTPKTPQASHSPVGVDYTEKELPDVPQHEERLQETQPQKGGNAVNKTDDEQSEIQSIMDQFSDETNGPKETEIMSPRLELAEQFKGKSAQFPPRRSSLDHLKPVDSIPSSAGTTSITPITVPKQAPSAGSEVPGTPRSVSSMSGLPPPEPESDQPFDFHRFLEQLRHRTADPVAKFLRSFLMEFGKKQWLVHEQVKIISDFLAFITNKMAQCEVWKHVSDAEFDNAKEGMEKLVMNRLYGQTFSPAIPPPPSVPRSVSRSKRRELERLHGPGRRGQHQEDVERDEILAQKIRIYSWIQPEHLDIPPVGNNGRRFINLAQQELRKIKGYRAPRDKVICILNCCKVIFGLLKHSKNPDTSADSFVPLLIYVVLKENPEHLVSNVQYILRFRNQDKLGGEAGYYLSSLSGAIQFIETLDRTSLTVSDEEFEKNVEAAVSAIAQENLKAESESSSSAHVTPRASTDAERYAHRKDGPSLGDGENAPVAGLLRTIQKPLSTIGKIFSDDTEQDATRNAQAPASSAAPAPSPRPPPAGYTSDDRVPSAANAASLDAQEAAARQASAEAAEARRIQRAEHKDVVETLSAMFPNLDRDIIDDVVRMKEGRVGLAVDACLALSSTE
ncbi:putative guanine nucleotide exchange factor Vps9 [Talaromyces proteolyticus]|uniref:Guanine nucleotide exchange factor Vps9 n=1 Tax=Talaromyces proteolyticus TaxID=1131652 RepID=A0AAD4KW97_9EURO|nr:putative guanine nucleotide exchange factor Vps9 [Talaromyces proteolyticus]KAH8697464.1 putative guanine nucleotide exchange factor Vps9 [Talaromyces proteolyticus]